MINNMFKIIAARVNEICSRKPTKYHIEAIIEELGIYPRNLGNQARNYSIHKCPEKLRLPIMQEITFLHIKGVI